MWGQHFSGGGEGGVGKALETAGLGGGNGNALVIGSAAPIRINNFTITYLRTSSLSPSQVPGRSRKGSQDVTSTSLACLLAYLWDRTDTLEELPGGGKMARRWKTGPASQGRSKLGTPRVGDTLLGRRAQ